MMELDFSKIKTAVAKQWAMMQELGALFVVDAQSENPEESFRNKIWATYLGAFPEGTDPMFRERTQHDCSCCRSFIRNAGAVVAIDSEGSVVSLWDVKTGDEAYDQVCGALSAYVKSCAIVGPFLTSEKSFGQDKSFGDMIEGASLVWTHFFVRVESRFQVQAYEQDTVLGKLRTKHQVLLRALRELDSDAVETTLELIGQNSLYRGSEFQVKLRAFKRLQDKFDLLPPDQEVNFVWSQLGLIRDEVAFIRNSAIGTLLVDLGEGKDLEEAVRAYEHVTAPSNYRRPTALITQSMIDSAREKIEQMGLLSALDRRLAVVEDLKITNILFADRNVKKKINPDAFDALKPTKAAKHSLDKVEEISIEKFISDVMPGLESMEILFEPSKTGNLMTLVAPSDPTAGKLFSWNNGFSWAYAGDVADSIKERVKNAGGNVTGDVCCRLAWHNHDDLDLHMRTPRNGHIYFSSKVDYTTGGRLDVDMNAGFGQTREPVENIFFPNIQKMVDGEYELAVHQFTSRERDNVGFEVEIDVLGEVRTFSYPQAMPTNKVVPVAKFTVKGGAITWGTTLKQSSTSREVWGLETQKFHRVKLLMNSPNHWDGEKGTGNKHYFFIVEGAVNPEPARGFFNEFLDGRLNENRKVFEVLGSKMKTNQGGEQVSGFGFSSTKKDSVIVNVSGTVNRKLKINF